MLTRDLRIFDIALLVAKTSECRYKFGAVIADGNRILSLAPNVRKTHPKQAHYGNWCVSIHAELNAILKCQAATEGCTLYVARQGVSRISKPCIYCMEMIRQADIKRIVYHNGEKLEACIL